MNNYIVTCQLPAPLEASAMLEQYGYVCGVPGFTRLDLRYAPGIEDNWHSFTQGYILNAMLFDRPVSAYRLGVSIAHADEHAHSWSHYFHLSRHLLAHFREISNPALEAWESFFIACGWIFIYSPYTFSHTATHLDIEVTGDSLYTTLYNIITHESSWGVRIANTTDGGVC